MSETLVTELLRYCKTAYGVDLSKDSRARDPADGRVVFVEVADRGGARCDAVAGVSNSVMGMSVRVATRGEVSVPVCRETAEDDARARSV